MRNVTFLLSISILFLAGCGDSGSDVDSGPHITLDGAADTSTPDAGVDLGTDAGALDMGLTGACAMAVMPLPTADVPRCTAETRACFDACPATSATCGPACLAADTTPPVTIMGQMLGCQQCVGYEEFACFDANMCHDAVAAFNCCADTACAATPTTACAMAMCPSQYMALASCVGASARPCVTSAGMFVSDCFAPATDGGVPTGDASIGDASAGDGGGGTTTDDAGGTTDDGGTTVGDAGSAADS